MTVPSRRAFISAGAAVTCAAFARSALGDTSSKPSMRMNLPGDYGARFRTAKRHAFHLHNEPAGSPLHQALTSLWSRVFTDTHGALMVIALPTDANLPMADAEGVADVASGRFEFVSVAAPILDAMVPDIGLQSLPYTFRTATDALALADAPAFVKLMNADLAPGGLIYLPSGTFWNGFRVIATNKGRPLHRLADVAGLRIRVPPSADLSKIFVTLGAEPIATPISEMRNAFLSGRIEAEENPPDIIRAFNLESVTHYVNVTNHIWTGFNTLANAGFWSSLPLEVRDRILTVLPAVRNEQVAAQEIANSDFLNAGSSGMEVIQTDLSDARERMKPVYAFMLAQMSPAARALAQPLLTRT